MSVIKKGPEKNIFMVSGKIQIKEVSDVLGVENWFLLPIPLNLYSIFFQDDVSWRVYLGSFQNSCYLTLEKNQTLLAKVYNQGVRVIMQLKSRFHLPKVSLKSVHL